MLLAIDTSTRTVGVALYDGIQVICESTWLSHDYHTVELAPAVAGILQRAGVSVSDLQVLALAVGPGSYTGLRIGMALVKGIALAGKLPIVGVPTLDVIAVAQAIRDVPLAVVIRAGRERLVVGWYHDESGNWHTTGKVDIATLNEFSKMLTSPTLVCGELTEHERRVLKRKRINVILASPAQSLRRASYLAELGWERWQTGQIEDTASLSPVYLHLHQLIPG